MDAVDELKDDRLPWLETADEEYEERPGWLRAALLAVLGLAVVAAAIAGYTWFQRTGGGGGTGELINAQDGPYKVKPDDPGGMKVEGEGDAVFAASEGATTNGSVNVGAMPEVPVAGKAAPKASPTPVKGASRVVATVPAAVAQATAPAQKSPGASSGSAVIQLGSFPSEAMANTAWARLSKRFNYIAPLGKSVEKAEVNGKAVHRLRVNAGSNGQARDLCGRLKAAGEACFLAPM
ncbi:SPOR domain-containing protein [Sphingomonas turrisvirgatae]|uniref:Sporulation protein n=1 Tax=Sphingomonas turrisvirgatae TaxID=1888892 RepID=A0A1E3LVY1_9SPHN|nr:SPOR domain-containing protein [Sphingomonas turrisvirgatae]ODP37913.1 sporulation protein [Sphingomonas turrisvirgatae]